MFKHTLYAVLVTLPCFLIGKETSPQIHRSDSYWYVGPDLVIFSDDYCPAFGIPTLHLGVGNRIQSNHLGWDFFAGASFPMLGAGTQVLFYPNPNATSQPYIGLGVKGYPAFWELPNLIVTPFASVGQETFSPEGKKTNFWQISLGPKAGYLDARRCGFEWGNWFQIMHLQYSYGIYF